MIAHKNQFKIAGAIWLVIVIIICQIVPAFASPATDESGNFLPSSYVIYWYIYNTDTGSYQSVSVTSSVTVDGLTFVFPTNLLGVNRLSFYLYAYGTSDYTNISIDAFYLESTISYVGSYFNGLCNLSGSPSLTISYYTSNVSSSRVSTTISADSSDNPSVFYSTSVPYFNRCYVDYNFASGGYIDGYFTVTFNKFLLNGEDISSLITVQNLDNASEDLGDLADELSVPTPDIDTIFNGMEDSISYIDDDNYQSTYSFFQNDTGIMATYITIVLAMATLGYILFGKRSA